MPPAPAGDRRLLPPRSRCSRSWATATSCRRIRPNYWRIRFALPEEGSGKLLELEFDELAQRVTGVRRLDITPDMPPTSDTLQPSEASPAIGGSGVR